MLNPRARREPLDIPLPVSSGGPPPSSWRRSTQDGAPYLLEKDAFDPHGLFSNQFYEHYRPDIQAAD